jgi:hypothetical protein
MKDGNHHKGCLYDYPTEKRLEHVVHQLKADLVLVGLTERKHLDEAFGRLMKTRQHCCNESAGRQEKR